MVSSGTFPEDVLEHWCLAMEDSAEGRASLCNLLYDCARNRVGQDVVARFIEEVIARWETSPPNLEAKDLFKVIGRAIPEKFFCQGPNIEDKAGRWSRVMDVEVLFEYNLHKGRVPFLRRGRLSRAQVRALAHVQLAGDVKRGNLTGSDPYVWVTPTDELDESLLAAKSDERAQEATILLGLLHYSEDYHLVEIRYPETVVENTELFAPTAFDGSPSLVYRSQSTDDQWGRTVHLETREDGLWEGLHRPIPFEGDFRLVDLGRLKRRTGFDWLKLIHEFPVRWDASGLAHLRKAAGL